MADLDQAIIYVHGDWNAWHRAELTFADLEEVHWLIPEGAPHPLVHAYVWCTHALAGQIPHGCNDASGPHRVRVCILKRHIMPSAYRELATRADATRSAPSAVHLSHAGS